MSWKSFLPSVFGSDEEKTNTAPASDRSGSGREADNSHAMAELEEAPAEEGGGWWGQLTSGLGLNGEPQDPVARARALIASGATDAQKLELLSELLTDEGWLDRVTSAETEAAGMVLDSMSEAGKQSFVDSQGGALAKQLYRHPEGTPWWADPLGYAVDRDASEDRSVVDIARDAWDSHRRGNEGLETLQAAQGGSLGGLTLDEAGDHSVSVDGDLSEGRATIQMPELRVHSFESSVGDAMVSTGPGVATGLSVTIDMPDTENAEARIDASVGQLDWQDLDIAHPVMSVLVPRLTLMALQLSAMRSKTDPGSLAEARRTGGLTGALDGVASAASWVESAISENLVQLGWELGPAIAELADTVSDVDALADGLMGTSAFTALDYSLAFASLSLPAGASMTRHEESGDVAYEMGSLEIASFSATMEQADRLSVLESEYQRLQGSDNLVDRQRVAALEGELSTVRSAVQEKRALDAKKQSGRLSTEEQARWTELGGLLKTGVMKVEIGVIELARVDAGGVNGEDLRVEGVSASMHGSALLGATDFSRDKVASRHLKHLDDKQRESAGGSDVLFGGIGDMGLDVSVDDVSAGSLETGAGSAQDLSANGVSVHAGGDYAGLEVDSVDAHHLDTATLDARSVSARGTEVVITGNDVGGGVANLSGRGLSLGADGAGATVDTAGATGIVFDANAGSNEVRRVSARRAEAGGITHHGEDSKTTVAGVSGTGLAATSVVDGVAGSVTADTLSSGPVHHSADGAVVADVASVGVQDLSLAGVGAAGIGEGRVGQVDVGAGQVVTDSGTVAIDGASLEGVRSSGLSSEGTGSVSVDHAVAEGLAATGKDGGELGVAHLHGQGLSASRDESGVSLGSKRVTVEDAVARAAAGSASLGRGVVDGGAARIDEHGVVATVDGAALEDVKVSDTAGGEAATTVGEVDRVDVGRSGVVLDKDMGFEGAMATGLGVQGVKVDLLHLPMDSSSESSAQAGAAGPLVAHPLASASGHFKATIPTKRAGAFTISASADEGTLPLSELDIGYNGGLFGRIAAGADIRVKRGKGLVASMGPFRLSVLMSSTEVDGLLSRREGGGKKGSIALQPFVESLASGQVEVETDEAALKNSPQDAIDAGVEALDEVGFGLAIDAGQISVDTSGLSLGDGRLGNDKVHAVLEGSQAQANAFTIEGTLGESLTVGSHRIQADSAGAVLPDGRRVRLEEVGLAGLTVTIDQPLTRARTISVDVRDMAVQAIRLGDTSRLKGAENS